MEFRTCTSVGLPIATSRLVIRDLLAHKILFNFFVGFFLLRGQSNSNQCMLQPQNILLESVTLRVKLCDFGLAKDSGLTATRGVGTPVYMAPELFDDELPAEDITKLDVYALAILMWTMWFKEAPFKGKSIHKVRYRLFARFDSTRSELLNVLSCPLFKLLFLQTKKIGYHARHFWKAAIPRAQRRQYRSSSSARCPVQPHRKLLGSQSNRTPQHFFRILRF